MRGVLHVLVSLLAAGLIVAGVSLWSVPAGLVTCGLFLLVTVYIDAYLRHFPMDGGQSR